MHQFFIRLYARTVLGRPLAFLALLLAVTAFFAYFVPSLKLDASSDALLIKDDPLLRIYDKSRLVFGSDDYVIVAYRDDKLFTHEGVALVAGLTERFRAIDGVVSVLSITTERLFRSPAKGGGVLGLLAGKPVFLDSDDCDLSKAREELSRHEVYSQNLITPDGEKTAFIIYLVLTFKERWLEKELYLIPDLIAQDADATKGISDAAREFKDLYSDAPDGLRMMFREITKSDIPDRDALDRAKQAFLAYGDFHEALVGSLEAHTPAPAAAQAAQDRLAASCAALEEALRAQATTPGRRMLCNRFAVARERWGESFLGAGALANVLAHRDDRAWLRQRLSDVKSLYEVAVDFRRERRNNTLANIRTIIRDVPQRSFFIAGLPIIWVDMMTYIASDIVVFGAVVSGFLILILTLVFRRLRFVVLPMAACLVVVAVVVGAMVLLRVRTTVITSNITSLLLILSMAHSVHLIVHYKEVLATRPFLCRLDAVKKAVRQMAVPCFYISATTAVGFLSLLISGIRPVMQFGWFMAFGIALAFAVTFVLVPAGLLLFPNGPSFYRAVKVVSPFRRIASLPVNRPRTVVLAAVCVGILSVVGIMGLPALGIPGLGVETIFVDYFHKDTDIYKGLIFVDQEMGGTSSLEVILRGEGEGYFGKRENFKKIAAVEAFFQDLPHVGKVISARSMTVELEKILAANGQKPPSEAGFPPRFLLRVLASLSGRGGERAALWSYISHDFSTARVFVRLREADPDLDRNALVARVRAFTEGNPDLDGLKVDVTGVFVLYANMLNSLIDGQIKTFGLVFVAIAAMFLALFRSLRIALLAMIPNILPVLAVLGFMGLADVPLDMNNIMIASVALGIAVDDTIHYIFRFRVEFARDGDYAAAVYRTHESIGRAILLTSVIITAGFSLLVASNFKPTVYFGFFTAFSMTAALFCAITLLPALLVLFRPLGPAKA